MKFLQFGLMVAVALLVLLGSAFWVMAQSTPPDAVLPESLQAEAAPEPVEAGAEVTVETSSVQALGLLITATVGTSATSCATSSTAIVEANTVVYYCYTLHNTGLSGEEQFELHNIRTSRGVSRDNLELIVVPGANNIRNTVSAGLVFSEVATVDATSFVTWTARPRDNEPQITANSRAEINVVAPSVSIEKTVGQDRLNCAATNLLTVPSGTNVGFCITIQNRGDITLTSHTLFDPPLNLNVTFNYTLAPNDRLQIIPNNLTSITRNSGGSLDRSNVTSAFTNTVFFTSSLTTGSSVSASGSAVASVGVGNTTVVFNKFVSTRPEDCSGGPNISVHPGTRVYYCAQIRNTGGVTLTQHQLTEQFLSIDLRFEYPLAPGETMNVTNDFLARNNLPIVFGPFEISPTFGNVINNRMDYVGTSPDGFRATGAVTSGATYIPTPTRTNTPRPDPTSTFTPIFTSTPSNTPIPLTPTFTPTPTPTPVTPSPTPTRSYAISLLETPTPRAQSANFPQGAPPQQDPNLQSTPDPFAQPTPDPFAQPTFPSEQQLPAQEPALATATQIAVDATSTAVAAVATASQLAVESAATAAAEAQIIQPDSPLATPTQEPALLPDGSQSGLPVAPGFETTPSPELPVITTTPGDAPLAPEESGPVIPAPGVDDLTVLPPVITAVIATETPAVVVLVVTNTPDPALALPEGQRPINLPTPTDTPDFVMAAARTFDVAVTTFGWLWFLVGSLVFFVTAGIVAGLFFRQSEVSRYDLAEPDYWLEEEPPDDQPSAMPHAAPHMGRRSGPRADEDWPADLP